MAAAILASLAAACGGESASSAPPSATAALPTAATTPVRTATPDSPATYVVKSGDTALEIAAMFGITLGELATANGKTEAEMDFLQIDQRLVIPR